MRDSFLKKRTPLACLVGLVLLLGTPVAIEAQTWIPPRHEGTFYFAYMGLNVGDHLFSGDLIIDDGMGGSINLGDSVDFGDISGRTAAVGVDYSLTDRLAVAGAVAYVASKYDGIEPESSIDDGSYRGALQDATARLRYMALRRQFSITPFAGILVPTTNYEIIGHSALGRNLKEFQVGSNFGWVRRPFFPDLYIQARYQFAFVESVADQNLDRTDVALEIGYFFTPRFMARTFGFYRNTHGGLDWLTDINDTGDFHIHDQAAALEDLRVGVGVSYTVTGSMDLYASFSDVVDGKNTHAASALNFGLSYRFGGLKTTSLANWSNMKLDPTAPRLASLRLSQPAGEVQ
jgi:hypothetical protein